jgi:hypothetical protein
MPSYKVHLVGGLATAAVLSYVVPGHATATWATFAAWTGSALLGALFPDIDTKSKGQRIFYAGLALCLLYALATQQHNLFIGLAVASMVPVTARHRGIFHHPWFITLLVIVALWMAPYGIRGDTFFWNMVFFAAGAYSHLILDYGFGGFWRRLMGR